MVASNGDGGPAEMPPLAERVALCSKLSSKVDPTWKIDNFKQKKVLEINSALTIHGFESVHGVANYLNIPFGQIPGRFLPSSLLPLDDLSGRLDATLYGPRCPQGPQTSKWLFQHCYEKIGCTQRMSELDCLSVNIYAPPASVGRGPWPVNVDIHGGAFVFGDATTERDGNHLVKRSIEAGEPIVFVTIPYRLGILGFLTSKELLEEQTRLGYEPVMSHGLQDQRIALQWVQKYIHLFGGDPKNVTLSGQSAGASSIWCHLKGNQSGLFQKVVMRSFPPKPVIERKVAQDRFDKIVEKLGIASDAPGWVKVAAMRSAPWEELLACWEGTAYGPCYDPGFFLQPSRPDKDATSIDYWIETPDWIESICLGATLDEASTYFGDWQDADVSRVKEVLTQFIDQDILPSLLDSPAFRDAPNPHRALANVVSEASFVYPIVDAAERLVARGKQPVYLYLLEQIDEHPGQLQGTAPHAGDLTLAFYQPLHGKYPSMVKTAEEMFSALSAYMYNREPWEPLGKRAMFMAFDGFKTGLRHLHKDRTARRVVVEDVASRERLFVQSLSILNSRVKARSTEARDAAR